MQLKIAVLVPTGGFCKAFFAHSLVALMTHPRHTAHRPDVTGIEMTLLMQEMSVIHDNRERLARSALDWGATHVLWVDDDMVFDPSVLSLLLGRQQPFVACNYPKRGYPIGFTALMPDRKTVLVTDAASSGLVEGSYAGLGMALVERCVFEAIPQPWFMPDWETERKTYVGEDFLFCDAAQQAGFMVWIDQDASKLIGHMGSAVFSWRHYQVDQSGPVIGGK